MATKVDLHKTTAEDKGKMEAAKQTGVQSACDQLMLRALLLCLSHAPACLQIAVRKQTLMLSWTSRISRRLESRHVPPRKRSAKQCAGTC